MSSRFKSTNPFEDDDTDDGDFVLVGKSRPAATYTYNTDRNPALPSSHNSTAGQARSQNPFDVSSGTSGYGRQTEPDLDPMEARRHQLMTQINESENRQLESTQRALASIYDSEAMGVATAEELMRQAEMLDNIENKTEDMQHTLKTSQRHINNIKSVFGGIKNWWAGKDKKATTTSNSQVDTSNANARLRAALDKPPAKVDTSGFFEADEDLDARFMAGSSSRRPGDGQYQVIQPVTSSAREEELDINLDMMSHGMSRLKGLAQGLGDEIERQNEQLDRINVKVGDTDDLVTNQNRQMRRILKK